jgi:hypothetical protein
MAVCFYIILYNLKPDKSFLYNKECVILYNEEGYIIRKEYK